MRRGRLLPLWLLLIGIVLGAVLYCLYVSIGGL